MKVLLRTVLFFDALFDLGLALVLLVSPFATLYAALQLPPAEPALYGQLLGLALLGFAWLLGQAAFRGDLTLPVARMAGPVNLASALLIAAWLVVFDLPVQGAGRIWLALLAAMLAFFALVQMPLAKRLRMRQREEALRRELRQTQPPGSPTVAPDAGAPVTPGGAPNGARPSPSPEVRREPVITPPPGYGPGTEVVSEPEPTDTSSVHHARQNPHP
ncbi:hypothetical protein L602_000600001450 [Cupriavidus gilardii J11]|uniref:Transmembrane protein n=1 Tax=Cupriavidus gilardii J11 TaxID=936133 RepID=A0A562B3I2_9BURK|nr:hypothetical protein [Cupriavidus gilardii]TWG79745.1 hypothetical protein L602_000600001450 [Cupriavidus gilardii J11]